MEISICFALGLIQIKLHLKFSLAGDSVEIPVGSWLRFHGKRSLSMKFNIAPTKRATDL
jgi:hypothetical protein